MPKANGKDAFYFPHDCNARNDNKILALRSVYGAEGYGIYWMLIEILRDQADYKYQLGKFAFKSLAMEMHCDERTLENIILDCCSEFADENSSLLSMDEKSLWSDSLLRRMKAVDEVSELRRAAARKRWDSKSDANALQKLSKPKQSRAEQSRPEQSRAEDAAQARGAVAADAKNEFPDVLEEYHRQIGRWPTDAQRTALMAYVDEMGSGVVQMALEKAGAQGGQSWSYVNTILSSWLSKGINTTAAVQEEQKSFKSGKSGPHTPGSVSAQDPKKVAENIDWMRRFLAKEHDHD